MKKYIIASVLLIAVFFAFPCRNVQAGEDTSAQLLNQLYEEVEMNQIDLAGNDYFLSDHRL